MDIERAHTRMKSIKHPTNSKPSSVPFLTLLLVKLEVGEQLIVCIDFSCYTLT